MKKFFLLGFAFLFIFSLSACDKIEKAIDEENNEADENITIEEASSYVGEWTLISSSLDGAPLDVATTELTLNEETFTSSTAYCSTQGDLVITDDTMDMFVSSHNCQGNPPDNYVFSFSLNEEASQITLINTQYGGTMVDVYKRVEDVDED